MNDATITIQFSDGTRATIVVDNDTAEDIATAIERLTGVRIEWI